MMLSRLLTHPEDEPSIYETLRKSGPNPESQGLLDELDERNLGYEFDEYRNVPSLSSPDHTPPAPKVAEGVEDEAENDVPPSLFIGGEAGSPLVETRLPDPVPGPTRATEDIPIRQSVALSDPHQRAAWMWANVDNLDRFLYDVYSYYVGRGIWSILLGRLIRLITMAFVVAFSSFLGTCIDYQKVPSSKRMPDILISQCTQRIRGSASLLLWILALFWFYKIFDYIRDFWRLRSIQNFYVHLLKVPDSDMQTISWPEIVRRIVALRDLNSMTADRQRSAKPRIDAHSIANRIMRRDNYFIALINKDILDFSLPIPYLQNRQLFSRTLEWNLQFCILDFVFDSRGHVRTLFLKDSHRHALIQGLRSRFVFAGCLSLLCGPFVVLYYVLVFFFRYFTEFQRNPSQIASRQYSPFAEWKFREFNELQHLFERRLNMSHPFAQRYMDQFPKDKTVQVAGLVAFVAGALASVLAVASLIDPESFLSFEVTHDRTVLFYLGIFGTIWAVARANMTEENLVFDPEYALRNVTDFTHYSPRRWQGRLHTNEVRADFARLYQTKVYIFLEEVLSIILAPLVLWFSLPRSCEGIVDFFREFTVHVDGLGHICSFALFDFHKTADAKLPEAAHTDDLRADYYSTQDNKMMASYYGFQDAYGPRSRPGALYHYEAGKGVHSRPSKSPWQSQTRPSVLQSPPDQLGKRPLRYAKLDMTPEQPEAQASRPRTSTESTTDLGGSWKTTRAGVLEESRASPEESTAGVLNMVYGLSRAQNDGQGARFA